MHNTKRHKIYPEALKFHDNFHTGGEVMKARIEQYQDVLQILKDDLQTVKTDVAVIKSNYVSKSDLAVEIAAVRTEISEAKSGIIIWVVSAVFLAQFIPVFIQRFSA